MSREIKSYFGQIFLGVAERVSIWQGSSLAAQDDPEKIQLAVTRLLYGIEVSRRLMEQTTQESFSVGEMERLFGIPRHRQMALINKGLSPARLKARQLYYSRDGAEELLGIEELRKFYPTSWPGWSDILHLEERHFPYWALMRNLGNYHCQSVWGN